MSQPRLLTREGFLTLLRRGQQNWTDEERRWLVYHLNWFEGEPYTDPNAATDPCDRADLIEVYLLNEVGDDPLANAAAWNEFCDSHPGWPEALEEHCTNCSARHADIAAMMAVEMPKAKAVGRRVLAQIVSVDPERGGELIEHYGADLDDPQDKGE